MRRWAFAAAATLAAATLFFVFAGSATGVVVDGYFIDDNNNQFEDDIDAVAEAGITKGCDAAGFRYCPTSPVTRGEMAAFLRRVLELPDSATNHFIDENGSQFEADINALADAGITTGCDTTGPRFCPTAFVSRAEMAAFLNRALQLAPSPTNRFVDDEGSPFEGDINAVAQAGITRGCDAGGTLFCPFGAVTRGEMAAFLRRALDLPAAIVAIPIGEHPALVCHGDGTSCTLTVEVDAGRQYRILEGLFQVLPASDAEMAELEAIDTRFSLTVDVAVVDLELLPTLELDGFAYRRWQHTRSFPPGTHTLVGTWHWSGSTIQTNTVTVRAAG